MSIIQNTEKQNYKLKRKSAILLFTFYFLLFTSSVLAQQEEDKIPDDVVPPPIKTLSKEEKSTLESQGNNIKKRTKIALELMEARIEKAEKSHTANSFQSALDDLAGFHAILDDTLAFMLKNDSGRADRSFINFEIYLRKQIPRLETIRREIPFKYGFHVGRIMKSVREARAKAVEPLFDDSVVPNASKKP